MDSYQGKKVFIVGASSGIGEALALYLAGQGARLILAARRLERLEVLAEQIRIQGAEVSCYACDVTREGSVEHVVAQVEKLMGPLDVVIANAGFGVIGTVEQLSLEDYRRQFETNVFGVLRTVKATLPSLKQSKGRLAVVGSVNGYVTLPGVSAYAMSKFSVRALCDALYYELRPAGVSVTHIAPGFVVSEFRKRDNQDQLHLKAKDPVPLWIQMPAAIAAKKISTAILRRNRERVVTGHGWWIVRFYRFFPGLLILLIRVLGIQGRHEAK